MIKDFDVWNHEKKRIHTNAKNRLYHEREIWWCSLGINIGFEQDGAGKAGQRPVLILKGLSRNTCFIIPLTTSPQKHPLRMSLGVIDGRHASALLSQARIIDTKRLINKVGFLQENAFREIRKALKDML